MKPVWNNYEIGDLKQKPTERSRIYVATKNDTKEFVVVKIMGSKSVDAKKHFDAERLALSTVQNNPRVVRYIESLSTDDFFFIALERYEADLRSIFKRDYSTSTVRVIVKQVAEALQHCLKFKIVHRDVKLANIFVKKFGENEGRTDVEVVLGDFGLAKRVQRLEERMDESVGTLRYMAPEAFFPREFDDTEFKLDPEDNQSLHAAVLQRLKETEPRGKPNYSYKCDIWSLGVVAHCLLSRCEDGYPFCCTKKDLETTKRDLFSMKKEDVEAWRNRITEYRIKHEPSDIIYKKLDGIKPIRLIDITRSMLDKQDEERPHYNEIIDELQKTKTI